MSTTPQFEIPTDLRKMTEQSMEQVRRAINSYLHFLQRGIPSIVMGKSELSNKVFGYAERNVGSAFDFTQRLAQVRDIQDLTRLQMEIHPSANAGDDRAGQGPERVGHEGGDGQCENPHKGQPIVLIAGHSPNRARNCRRSLRRQARRRFSKIDRSPARGTSAPRQIGRPGKPS